MIHAYLRVSTDEQAQSGLGMDAQLEAIAHAIGTPDHVYKDEGISGASPNRPGLLAALEALKDGDTLAIAKRDRLARDTLQAAWVEKEVKKAGARVASAAGEGTENDDPTNVLMRNIIDSFAQYERDIIAARTSAALAQKRERGQHTGGNVPYGYQLEGDGIHLCADPDEAELVNLVYGMRAVGATYKAICERLKEDGYTTRKGGKWYPQTVKQILEGKQAHRLRQVAA